MYSNNKQIRDVADIAAQIMYGQTEKKEPEVLSEELKGGQHKIDANKNNKVDAHDFKLLRSKKKVEEEVKEIDEVKMADLPSTKVQGRGAYGSASSKPEPHAVDMIKGPKEKELKDIEAEKKKKKFSEMVNLYQEKGLKSLSEMLVKEEPDNEQFTKELEDAKAKSEGKKRNTEIAKGAVQAVKQEEVQQIDELNKDTLKSYVSKATDSARTMPGYGTNAEKSKKTIRHAGISKATEKLAKEETEITDEMIFEVLENAGIDFESLSDDELQEVAAEAHDILIELSTQNGLNTALDRIKRNSKKNEGLAEGSDILKAGSSVMVPHKGKMVPGKVVRYDSGKGGYSPAYVVDIGEYESKIVPAHSIKQGMAGFKERYGDRAKNVMYATANKQAMKD